VEAQKFLEEGTKILEEGDVESAKALYLRSIQIKRTPGVRNHHSHFRGFLERIIMTEEEC